MCRAALAVLVILFSTAAHAHEHIVNCAKKAHDMSTAENGICSHREFKKAEHALDLVYQATLEVIRKTGNDHPYFSAENWEAELVRSQRAWLAFREADCDGLVVVEWQGGTGVNIGAYKCMTELTNARAQSLRKRYAHF